MTHLRPRNFILAGGTILVFLFLFLSDPTNGALTITLASQLATPVVAVWFAHLARKALFDYIDMGALYRKALENATASAIVFGSICLVIYGLLSLFGGQVRI